MPVGRRVGRLSGRRSARRVPARTGTGEAAGEPPRIAPSWSRGRTRPCRGGFRRARAAPRNKRLQKT